MEAMKLCRRDNVCCSQWK